MKKALVYITQDFAHFLLDKVTEDFDEIDEIDHDLLDTPFEHPTYVLKTGAGLGRNPNGDYYVVGFELGGGDVYPLIESMLVWFTTTRNVYARESAKN